MRHRPHPFQKGRKFSGRKLELLRAQAVCLCSLFLCVRLCRAASFPVCATRGSFCEQSAARNGSSDAAAIVCAQRIKFFQKRKILREKSVVKIFSIWYNKSTVAAIAASKMSDGGIAQLVRALASHARGRRFESYCPYQSKSHIRRGVRRVWLFSLPRQTVHAALAVFAIFLFKERVNCGLAFFAEKIVAHPTDD